MNLDKKYKLQLSHDQAGALKSFLVWVAGHEPATAWEKLMLCLVARIIAKIHKRDMIDTGKVITLQLNEEQSTALQMTIATFDWPGNYIDHALHITQQQLSPLIHSSAQPPPIAWDAPLELGER